jgi:hypothetical protein
MTGDNSHNDMDRVEIGPTKLAFDEGPKLDWICPISNKCAGFAIKGWCSALMPATMVSW